jgi:hypothetical protein
MLGHIFYFFGLFIALMSLSNLLNYFKYVKVRKWSETFKKVTNRPPIITDFRNKDEYNTFITYPIFLLLQMIWFIFGLISNSWYVFLTIIVLNILISYFNRLISVLFIEKITGFIFNIIKLVIVLLLTINHFHLHYDWIELLR